VLSVLSNMEQAVVAQEHQMIRLHRLGNIQGLDHRSLTHFVGV